MAIIRRNASQRLTLWSEVTLGTRPATPTGYVMPIFGHGLGVTEQPVVNQMLRYDPNALQPGRGRWQQKGQQISCPLEVHAVGKILKAYFGTPTDSGAGDPYSHKFKRGTTDGPSFGAEGWDSQISKGDSWDGLVMSGLEITVDTVDGFVAVNATVEGLGIPTPNAGTQVCTPSTFGSNFVAFANCKVQLDAAQSNQIVKATCKLSRQVSIRAIADGTRASKYIILGKETTAWSIQALFDDADTVRQLATGLAAHSISLIMTDPSTANHDLTITSDEMQLFLSNVPAVGNQNEREIQADGVGYYASGSNSSAVVATLRNEDSTVVF